MSPSNLHYWYETVVRSTYYSIVTGGGGLSNQKISISHLLDGGPSHLLIAPVRPSATFLQLL